ncbi:MAG: calcium-binding protein, partial [Pseudomonadota bacterium]
PDAPVIIISEAPLVLGDTVNLSGNTLIAHSAYDFDVDDRDGFAGPWSYFKVTSDDAVQTALITMAGGETRGEAWNPYLGNPGTRPLAVTAGAVVPVDFNNNSASPRNEFAILERFTASDDGFVTINAFWDVRDSSEDGVVVEISHNGDLLFSDQVFNPANGHVLEATLSGIGLSAGDTIDFRVGTGGNAVGGDRTERLYEIISETRVSPAADKTVVDIAPDARRVFGSDEDELIDGSGHANALRLYGKAGSDQLIGSAHNDVLIGGTGADALIGGDGDDVFAIDAADITVSGGEGHDRVRVNGTEGVHLILQEAAVEVVRGGAGDDHFDGTGVAAALRLYGEGGADRLIGGSGHDVLVGGLGADALIGGSGNDVLVIDGTDVTVMGGEGHDRVRVNGTDGVHLELHEAAVEVVQGGIGDDHLNGAGAAVGLRLHGGGGADTLQGGHAADTLIGGTGADTFVLSGSSARDRILDFGAGDTLLIASALAPTLADVEAAAEEVARGLHLQFNDASIMIVDAARDILSDSVFIV